MSLRHKLVTAKGLTWREHGLILQAWFLLLGVDWGLRVFPFRRVQNWTLGDQGKVFAHSQNAELSVQSESDLRSARQLGAQVSRAARNHVYPMSCLRRSLVLQGLLARRGIAAELRIGVRRDGERLQAHAWVEVAGVPIEEPEEIAAAYPPLNEVDEVAKKYEQNQ